MKTILCVVYLHVQRRILLPVDFPVGGKEGEKQTSPFTEPPIGTEGKVPRVMQSLNSLGLIWRDTGLEVHT